MALCTLNSILVGCITNVLKALFVAQLAVNPLAYKTIMKIVVRPHFGGT